MEKEKEKEKNMENEESDVESTDDEEGRDQDRLSLKMLKAMTQLQKFQLDAARREARTEEREFHRHQRDEETRRLQVSNAVSNQARLIGEFDRTKIAKFLCSVKTVYDTFLSEDAQEMVLKMAKLKLPSDSEISNTQFETFKAFQAAVLDKFRPAESLFHVQQQLTLLSQEKGESVTDHGKRAQQLMEKLIDAKMSHAYEKGRDCTQEKQEEAEEEARERFKLGLNYSLRPFVHRDYESMTEVICAAEQAESNNQLQRMLFESKKAKSSEPSKSSNDKNDRKFNKKYPKKTEWKSSTKKKDSQDDATSQQEQKTVEKIPFKGKDECFKCHKPGHRAVDCGKKVKKINNTLKEESDCSTESSDEEQESTKNASGSQSIRTATLKTKRF